MKTETYAERGIDALREAWAVLPVGERAVFGLRMWRDSRGTTFYGRNYLSGLDNRLAFAPAPETQAVAAALVAELAVLRGARRAKARKAAA